MTELDKTKALRAFVTPVGRVALYQGRPGAHQTTGPGHLLWTFGMSNDDEFEDDNGVGYYWSAADAADRARAVIAEKLDRRREQYDDWGDDVVDCPACGDPARHHVSVHPGGGMSWFVECESCLYEESDSA
jgi:hypothetical protein